jgi:uncharacterized protein (TIGR02145 family)
LKYLLIILLTVVFSSTAFSQSEVKIGNQIWMAKNLDVDKFRNGRSIPQAKSISEWRAATKAKKPTWCYYSFDENYGNNYGKLYNWYAVNDPRGLAPEGYHVPSDSEWTILCDFLGGENVAGRKLKSTSGGLGSGNGDNSSGFNGLPGGFCDFSGFFYGGGGSWWSSTENGTEDAWGWFLHYDDGSKVDRASGSKDYGLSVRCLKD